MTDKQGSGSGFRLVLVGVAVIVVLVLITQFDVQRILREALDWIDNLGTWGVVAFAAIYILAAVLFLPGSVLTLGAGVVFGVVKGAVIVILSATVAATAAFLVGRYLAREWVAKSIANNRNFQAIDEAVGKEGWKIVGLTRLSPIFPFNLLNYAFGITRVAIKDYVLASFFGMMPGTLMYVYVGSLAGDLAALGAGERTRSATEWALYVAGLLATVVVTVYVTRVARKALSQRVELDAED